MALVNIWHLRKVADAAAKPCDICYKPTTSVLITPDKQDHFYVCQGHVKDRGFCSPIINGAEVAAQKKKEEMDHEIKKLQEEYEEKKKKKKNKKKNKKRNSTDEDNKEQREGNNGKKEKEDEKKTNRNENPAEKEKTDNIIADAEQPIAPNVEEIPRIYELHKVFYQKRLDRKRNAEMAKRDRERHNALKNPTLFPSVPRNNPG